MGDGGSLLLGLTITILSIQFIESPQTLTVLNINCAIAIVAGIMFIPAYDTLRVFTSRILKGQSPFTPDNNHIHVIQIFKKFHVFFVHKNKLAFYS